MILQILHRFGLKCSTALIKAARITKSMWLRLGVFVGLNFLEVTTHCDEDRESNSWRRGRGCFRFSRFCANVANLIDRRSSTPGRRPMPAAASPSIFRQVHFLPQVLLPLATLGTRRRGRPDQYTDRATDARRTSGQIVLARICVRTPCFAVSYVLQADGWSEHTPSIS